MTKIEKYILSLLHYAHKQKHNHKEQIHWLFNHSFDRERAKQCGMSKAIKEWLWCNPDCFLITHNRAKMILIAQEMGWLPIQYSDAEFKTLETYWEHLHASALISLFYAVPLHSHTKGSIL